MATWAQMMMDNTIADDQPVTAPDGSKVTMGQVREGWLARQRELDQREAAQKQAQVQLADVFQKLQEQKNTVDQAQAEIATARAELEAREAAVASGDAGAVNMNEIETLKKTLGELTEKVDRSHKNQIEMASIWLDEKWTAAVDKFRDDLPPSLTKAQLLKYAQDNNIKSNGVIDLAKAAEHLTQPKVRERELKEAEERGARRRDEEITMASMGGRSAFGPRGSTVEQGAPKKFSSLDDAFTEAAKDASVWNIPVN